MTAQWTKQEDNRLLFYVGLEPPASIAARLGRTERAVITRYYREHGGSFMRATARTAGMAATECATVLGVPRQRIQYWIGCGWIGASKRTVRKRVILSVSAEALEAFIRARGGLLDNLHPLPIWRDIVEEARRDLRARMICRAELAPIFGFTVQMFTAGKGPMKDNFPAPAFALSAGQYWYERAAIKVWLETAPARYRTARVLRTFS